MKAWQITSPDEEMQEISFGDTRSKAIVSSQIYANDTSLFLEIRAVRAPEWDGEPHEINAQEYLDRGWFIPCRDCGCAAYKEDGAVVLDNRTFDVCCDRCAAKRGLAAS